MLSTVDTSKKAITINLFSEPIVMTVEGIDPADGTATRVLDKIEAYAEGIITLDITFYNICDKPVC